MKTRVFTFAAIFTLICSLAYSQADAKQDNALKSLVKKMVDAQLAYDPVTLDKLFTTDYIEVSPLGEFDPRAKVLGFYKPEEKPDANKLTASVEIGDTSIRKYGHIAVVIVQLNFSMTSEGRPLSPRSLRVTLVCRKEKSAWKIASAQYTGIRPQVQPAKPTE